MVRENFESSTLEETFGVAVWNFNFPSEEKLYVLLYGTIIQNRVRYSTGSYVFVEVTRKTLMHSKTNILGTDLNTE